MSIAQACHVHHTHHTLILQEGYSCSPLSQRVPQPGTPGPPPHSPICHLVVARQGRYEDTAVNLCLPVPLWRHFDAIGCSSRCDAEELSDWPACHGSACRCVGPDRACDGAQTKQEGRPLAALFHTCKGKGGEGFRPSTAEQESSRRRGRHPSEKHVSD